MTDARVTAVQRRRLCAALAIVVALVFMPPLANAVRGAMATQGEAVDESPGFEMRSGSDFLSTLEDVERQADATLGTPSGEFVDEIGVPSGAYGVRVSKEGDTVGYLLGGDAATVAEELDGSFVSKGWTPVSLGALDGHAYLKSEGVFTWMLVTATQVGDTVSVVIRCPAR